ncbi:MAG: ribosome biogenesis/translation initiation ATPase RLI [Conexivisphaera sp.]
MTKRIAVIDRERCHPKKCGHECQRFCPPQLTGHKVVEFGDDGYPTINESLCIGCNICVRKCPFSAITIVNLAEEPDEAPVHQYGPNSFRLYRLPMPRRGRVVGILGRNGVGKTTALNILSGKLAPNLGSYDDPPQWREVLRFFQGTELRDYLERVASGTLKISVKPQAIEQVRSMWSGSSMELLSRFDDSGRSSYLAKVLGLEGALERRPDELSGGELQRLAVAMAASREADAYFFDEPGSHNDVYQRLAVARVIRDLARSGKYVLLVEHDLTFLDYAADFVHVVYGRPGIYGIISNQMSLGTGVNSFLEGYLPGDNMRIRDTPIVFDLRGVSEAVEASPPVVAYTQLEKSYPGFSLTVSEGDLRMGEVLGIVGANALGKTTFLKILAGADSPDSGSVYMTAKISYKPQYISTSYQGTVEEALSGTAGDSWSTEPALSSVVRPLGVDALLNKSVSKLSGGELQRLAIALCLLRDADVYALDEPSAFLDVEERLALARILQKYSRDLGKGIVVIDHDVGLVDFASDRLVVFTGEPGRRGQASSPMGKRDGMNAFLRELGVTYRRDPSSGRPRVNKPGSRLDRYQKDIGEYYYLAPTEEGEEEAT